MNPEIKIDNNQSTGIENWFRKVSSDEIFIKSQCVFTENPFHVIIGQVYEVHDLSKEGINLLYIKLVWIYLRGMTFHIVGIDIRTGELVHKCHRLGNDSIPCSFLIADLLYFDIEELSAKVLRGLSDNELELLEFDFSDK